MTDRHLMRLALLIGVVISASWVSCVDAIHAPQVIRGQIDLREWDFDRDGSVQLTGEWEFYWQQFLPAADLTRAVSPEPSGYIQVPSNWNGYRLNGDRLPHTGYITYRLGLFLKRADQPLAFKLGQVASAYRLYVNGRQLLEMGVVGSTAETTVARFAPVVAPFMPDNTHLEIIMHVANFASYRDGILDTIQFGKDSQIQNIAERQRFIEALVLGSIGIMGLYHIGLFLYRRQDASPLYFALFCGLMASRTIAFGENYAAYTLRVLPYETLLKIVFLSQYAGFPVCLRFAQTIFPQDYSSRICRGFYWGGGIFSVLVVVTSSSVYSRLVLLYNLVVIVGIGYIMYGILQASLRRKQGAAIFLGGMVVLFLSALNDILAQLQIIHTQNMLPFGLLGFIICQAIILSLRFSTAFVRVEQLSQELEEKNSRLQEADQLKSEFLTRLEYQVAERTRELEFAKKQADSASQMKSQFLSSVSHELRTPLNIILGFAQLLLRVPHPPEEQEQLENILRSGNRLTSLVNQLLEASKVGQMQSGTPFDLDRLLADVDRLERLHNNGSEIVPLSTEPTSLVPEDLKDLPEQVRTQLQSAVERLDIEIAQDLIKQVHEQHAPLAQALSELVKNYRFDTLQKLFRQSDS